MKEEGEGSRKGPSRGVSRRDVLMHDDKANH